MPVLEPSVALATCENALRQLMAITYRQAWGSRWLERISTDEQRREWERRAVAEAVIRTPKGVSVVPNTGLAYANFYELVDFADKHWQPLAEALGRKSSTFPLLKRFENLRNSVGHSRELVISERELLSGIAGQIRNQVTRFMSAQDPVGDFYPRIESIIDDFGNRYPITPDRVDSREIRPSEILRPGDHVTFTCVAIDPQDRTLKFTLRSNRGADLKSVTCPSGQLVDLTWEVLDSDVQASYAIQIFLEATGTNYHRHGRWDDKVVYYYRIDQPQ